MRRSGSRTLLSIVTLGLVLLPQQAMAKATVSIVATFAWDGTRECASARTDSVICISGEANVRGLGHVEYARDAVSTGEQTPDGCPKLSTLGTIWVTGGTAILTGKPANSCGAKDNPDAHYLYTISHGTGVLAGATGSGDIVADHGVDRWHGTLSGQGLPLKVTAIPPASSAPATTAAAATSAAATSAAPTSAAATSSSVTSAVTSAAQTTSATPAASGSTTPPAVAAGKSSSSSVAVWVAVPAIVIVVGGAVSAVLLRRRRAGSGQGPA